MRKFTVRSSTYWLSTVAAAAILGSATAASAQIEGDGDMPPPTPAFGTETAEVGGTSGLFVDGEIEAVPKRCRKRMT